MSIFSNFQPLKRQVALSVVPEAKTTEELNDKKFYIFRLHEVLEQTHRSENFRDQMIGSLKLNLAAQQRMKDVIKKE